MDKKVLKTRVITGLLFGAIMTGGLLYGRISAGILLFIIGAGCLYEYIGIVKGRGWKNFLIPMLLYMALSVITYSVQKMDQHWTNIFGFHNIVIITGLYHLYKPVLKHRSHYFIISILYIMLPIFLTMYTLHWKASDATFLLYLFILIWVSDSSAYFVGSQWGRHKLFEKISPKKTWEGFIGAGVFTLLAAFLIAKTTGQIPLMFWLIAAIWTWIMGTFGDLFESSIKREFGIKDSGSILPGHGGFLDRFDSFLFVAAFGSWILNWMP